MLHLPLRFLIFITPSLRQPFRRSFDKQTGLFSLDRWSVFYDMAGLSKQYRPAHNKFNFIQLEEMEHGVFMRNV